MGKGKENSSGKEKKLARAAALAAEKERKQHIAQAAAITTPLSAFEPMVKAAQAKFGVDVMHAASASLSAADHDFCFALLKRNMESLRLDAGWGFNDSGERATLRDEEAHFLEKFKVVAAATEAQAAFACGIAADSARARSSMGGTTQGGSC